MIFRKAAVLLLLTAAVLNLLVGIGYLLISGVVTGSQDVVGALLAGSGNQSISISVAQAFLLCAFYSVVALLAGFAALRHRLDRQPGFVLFAAMLILVVEAIDVLFTGVGANVIGIAAGIVTVIAVMVRKGQIEPNPVYADRMVGFYGDDNGLKLFGAAFYGGVILAAAGLLFFFESLLRASPYDQVDYAQLIRSYAANSTQNESSAAPEIATPAPEPGVLQAGGADDEPVDVAQAWADQQFPSVTTSAVQTGVTIENGRQYIDVAIYELGEGESRRLLRRTRLDMDPDGWKLRAEIGPQQLWEARPAVLPADNEGRCFVLAARAIERVFGERWPDDLPEKVEQKYRDTWFDDAKGYGQVIVQLSTASNYLGHTLRYACRKKNSRLAVTEFEAPAYVDPETGEITTEEEL